MATLIGVTVVNFQDCHRKAVTSFVEDCLKKKQTPRLLISLNDMFFGKIY